MAAAGVPEVEEAVLWFRRIGGRFVQDALAVSVTHLSMVRRSGMEAVRLETCSPLQVDRFEQLRPLTANSKHKRFPDANWGPLRMLSGTRSIPKSGLELVVRGLAACWLEAVA